MTPIGPPSALPEPPTSWLAPAVLSALCCFPLTGVAALYFAAQVDVRWSLGDRRGAVLSARRARSWTIISFVLWVIMLVVMVGTGRAGRLLNSGVL
ncbi:MAG: CD225/dispanin family protein [Candidatus Nanopelagicales bacterium]|nr:CD225/dispanin family protein [Candidatus Nanopelagicales bacterium]